MGVKRTGLPPGTVSPPSSVEPPPAPPTVEAPAPPADSVQVRQTPLATGDSPSPVAHALTHVTRDSGWEGAVASMVSGDRAAIRRAISALCKAPQEPATVAQVVAFNERVASAFA